MWHHWVSVTVPWSLSSESIVRPREYFHRQGLLDLFDAIDKAR